MNNALLNIRIILIGVLICSFTLSKAQLKSTDPKHENHYRAKPVDTNDLKIEFEDFHSQQTFTLVKIKVTNKTSDYIVVKPREIVFKYDFGEYYPTVPFTSGLFSKETLLLGPRESGSRTLKVTGGDKFHVERLSLEYKGFYKIISASAAIAVQDFQLPPSVNSVSGGPFKCSLDKLKKETKESEISFKCSYEGSDVGILDPDKVTLKLENGNEYVNDTRKGKVLLLFNGEDEKLTASFHVAARVTDMQFANMWLVWKNTFSESKMTAIQLPPSEFTLDPGLTEGKNR